MKKIYHILILSLLSSSVFAQNAINKIDASDDKKLEESFTKLSMSLNPDMRQDFSNASAIIMFYGGAKKLDEKQMRSIFNNKSPQELIDLAQKLCPSPRNESYTLKAKTQGEFSSSFIVMLMNLPIEKQRKFAGIIAQIMMISQMQSIPQENVFKDLDGLTANQIINKFEEVKKVK